MRHSRRDSGQESSGLESLSLHHVQIASFAHPKSFSVVVYIVWYRTHRFDLCHLRFRDALSPGVLLDHPMERLVYPSLVFDHFNWIQILSPSDIR